MLVSTMFGQRDQTVHRGYRLHLTNLEDKPLTYLLRFWVTPPDAQPHWAAVLNEFFVLYAGISGDLGYGWSGFARSGSVYVSGLTFEVQPHHTVSLGFIPSTSPSLSQDVHFVEGYVTLDVPRVKSTQGRLALIPVAQSDGDVKVLLNPEMTMKHLDGQGAAYTQNLDGIVTGRVGRTLLNFDTVEPMVPASGKAENLITPDGSSLSVLAHGALVALTQGSGSGEAGLAVSAVSQIASPADRLGALIELLNDLDTKPAFVKELNKLLDENQVAARICPKGN